MISERAAIILKAPSGGEKDYFLSDSYSGNQWFLKTLEKTYTTVKIYLQDNIDLQSTLKRALEENPNRHSVDVIIHAHGSEKGISFGKEVLTPSQITAELFSPLPPNSRLFLSSCNAAFSGEKIAEVTQNLVVYASYEECFAGQTFIISDTTGTPHFLQWNKKGNPITYMFTYDRKKNRIKTAIPPAYPQAKSWSIKESKKGNPAAAHLFGILVQNENDTQNSIFWFLKSALLGYDIAFANLHKLAEGGNSLAQQKLGQIYLTHQKKDEWIKISKEDVVQKCLSRVKFSYNHHVFM